MKLFKYLLAIIIPVAITGCSTPKLEQEKLQPEFNSSNFAKKVFYNNIYYKTSGKNFSKFDLAVINSLKERNMLTQEINSSMFILSAKLIEEKPPKAGLTMEGSITVEYELYDRRYEQGNPKYKIFNEIYTSRESAGITDESYGAARAVLIVQNYVKSNIKKILIKLDEVSAKVDERNVSIKNEEAQKQKTLTYLRESFSKFNIFSTTPFYEIYPYKDNGNYTIQELAQYSNGNLIPRLKNANKSELETFKRTYYHLLDAYFKDKIDSLLTEKSLQIKIENKQQEAVSRQKDGSISGGLPPIQNLRK